ncbi:MAG: DUF131 domain-containing protein [Candidatus Methanomethylicia archaeon]
MKLYQLGLIFVIIGVITIFLGVIITLMRRKGEVEGGGIIIIGPFPILWGTSSKILRILSIITLLFIILIVIWLLGG